VLCQPVRFLHDAFFASVNAIFPDRHPRDSLLFAPPRHLHFYSNPTSTTMPTTPTRCAIPCYGAKKDPDIEPTLGCYGAKCFEFCPNGGSCCAPAFACCADVPALVPSVSDAAFVAAPVKIGDLYMINHCCCLQQSAYIPDSFQVLRAHAQPASHTAPLQT